jgi:hypothetical protein
MGSIFSQRQPPSLGFKAPPPTYQADFINDNQNARAPPSTVQLLVSRNMSGNYDRPLWAGGEAMGQHQLQNMANMPTQRMISVDVNEFIRTRDAVRCCPSSPTNKHD